MSDQDNTTKKHVLTYGENLVLSFNLTGTRRKDLYTSYESGLAAEEERACNGHKDFSAPVTNFDRSSPHYRRYNHDCPCCFLHQSHTVEYHERFSKEGSRSS